MGYATLAGVKNRMYVGSSSVAPTDAGRDSVLEQIIEDISRRFDKETGRQSPYASVGAYDVSYDVRVYSGKGLQLLKVDDFASLGKIEYNTAPIATPNWVDITSEVAAGKIAVRPPRFWPKRAIFRLGTWIVDPYQNGNTRLTGIFGAVQPDLTLSPPVGMSPAWNGLTDLQIQALAPIPSGPTYGWWRTPLDVEGAVADWSIYEWNSIRAGFGSQAGTKKTDQRYDKSIPPNVMDVITNYRGGRLKLALIGLDGFDATDPIPQGGIDLQTRWAGWQSFDPNTGQPN